MAHDPLECLAALLRLIRTGRLLEELKQNPSEVLEHVWTLAMWILDQVHDDLPIVAGETTQDVEHVMSDLHEVSDAFGVVVPVGSDQSAAVWISLAIELLKWWLEHRRK